MSNLTDLQIRQWIKAGERFEGRSDGNGLTLRYRAVDAAPMWRFRYRLASKQRVMDLGSYAVLSLADARKQAHELCARVALGYDVAGEKQERKQAALVKLDAVRCAITVAQVADDYFERMILGHWKHPNIVRSRIVRDIKPHIGELAVDAVKPLHVDAMLQAIVRCGAPTIANNVLRLRSLQSRPARSNRLDGQKRTFTQLLSELDRLKREILKWEAVATPTTLDKAMRDDRLEMLREQYKAKKVEYWGTGYSILTRRDRQPPSADAGFNYLLHGEYRNAQRGEEKELAEGIISTDADKGIVRIVESGELTRDQFKRTFGTLADDKVR